ncbi:Nuclear speckle splicing regulatory protein like [Melia azedarach]|uniref:Nuclear speckle splicing regulatory protein like n=1 Tax=Melia azedarach TaxID=155640 RepID=A0ACC1XLY1_MELAZ|nr:Nuclear speckle splicing regulatory protein like [Melia azedarach]
MVSKVEEAMKRQQQQQEQNKGRREHCYQQQKLQMIPCNKGKANKFKRSSSNLEEDGVSSAILLLACIACTPSY